ncbi:alpha/beta fold hydrolase [Solimonas terrae]|uniref:Alpha/beta fold hydrolase n=1 Tax=Solimonas terrae TaxID=1396819 RepID=A0A6M2BPF2_9GAMM|nr:alpha/beta fold hydrolase [Solimonas terrae]NGY04111.1 alpha/beta fold hydrolase [Solimonas terrae]
MSANTTSRAGPAPETREWLHIGGAGTPLVLLHGLGGTWRNWQPVLKQLEARHRVIAITMPGHADAAAIAGTVSIANLADTLLAQLRALGVDSAHVAGNSLGGWIAVELARRGFARSVTAISPAGAWRRLEDRDKLRRAARIGARLLPLIYALLWPFMGIARVRKLFFADTMEHGERVTKAEFKMLLRSARQCRMLPALLDQVASDGPVQPLAAGAVPIRVAWCEFDRVIPFENYGRPFLDRIAGHEHVAIAGVGHVPMWDDPELVVGTILDVTRRIDGATRDGGRFQ